MAGHSVGQHPAPQGPAGREARRIWTRVIREIMVAARQGGGDLAMNPRLRLAVDKAKAANMPADTIRKNIDKATGSLEGVNYEEVRYEGYGIGGAAVIVDCHDRQPRAHGGRGAPRVQQVRRQPRNRGLGRVPVQALRAVRLRPGDERGPGDGDRAGAGAEDVVTDDDGAIEVICGAPDFEAVKNALEAAASCPRWRGAEVTMRPENWVELAGEDAARMQKLLDVLEELDDVQDVPQRRAGRTPRPRSPSGRAEVASMKALVIGSGGREHALAWKLAASPRVQKVFVAPGNGGTARDPRLQNVPITEVAALADFAAAEKVALAVVGPGGDAGRGRRRRVPVARAADLRADACRGAARKLKAFAKDFMQRHAIPTAQYATFTGRPPRRTRRRGARRTHRRQGRRPGGGQGRRRRDDRRRGAPGGGRDARHPRRRAVVIEEFLVGEEASFIVVCDGRHVLPLATSQDHKRLLDGDRGPNTGGMGAYSPAPVVTPNVHARVMHEIILPTIRRHGRGRAAVHRIPVRRPDDRRAGPAAGRSSSTRAWAIRRPSRSCCA